MFVPSGLIVLSQRIEVFPCCTFSCLSNDSLLNDFYYTRFPLLCDLLGTQRVTNGIWSWNLSIILGFDRNWCGSTCPYAIRWAMVQLGHNIHTSGDTICQDLNIRFCRICHRTVSPIQPDRSSHWGHQQLFLILCCRFKVFKESFNHH